MAYRFQDIRQTHPKSRYMDQYTMMTLPHFPPTVYARNITSSCPCNLRPAHQPALRL